jgi:hypothetical protein
MTNVSRTGTPPHAKTLPAVRREPDIFDHARERDIFSHTFVRRVASRFHLSAHTAALVAELAGLRTEGSRNG